MHTLPVDFRRGVYYYALLYLTRVRVWKFVIECTIILLLFVECARRRVFLTLVGFIPFTYDRNETELCAALELSRSSNGGCRLQGYPRVI